MTSQLDAIVFDIGRVLVDFSLDGFAGFLRSKGAAVADRDEFIAASGMREYELGKVTSQAFLKQVAALLSESVDPEEIALRWQNIFTPKPRMLSLLEQLSQTHRIFLLSNTNELHWQYLENEFSLSSKVAGITTSFHCGALKPMAAIYENAEETHSLVPQRTVFIDDIAEHVQAAQSRGWHGIQHVAFEQTTAELAELGACS